MTDDAARVIAVLMRSDDDALCHVRVRTGAAQGVPLDDLRWWRDRLRLLGAHLAEGDAEELSRWREALEAVEARPPAAVAPPIVELLAPEPPLARASSSHGPALPALAALAPPPGGLARPAHASPWAAPPPIPERATPPPPPPPAAPQAAAWSGAGAARGVSDTGGSDGTPSTGFMTPAESWAAGSAPATPFAGRTDPAPSAVEEVVRRAELEGAERGQTAFMDPAPRRAATPFDRHEPPAPERPAEEPRGEGGQAADPTATAVLDLEELLAALVPPGSRQR